MDLKDGVIICLGIYAVYYLTKDNKIKKAISETQNKKIETPVTDSEVDAELEKMGISTRIENRTGDDIIHNATSAIHATPPSTSENIEADETIHSTIFNDEKSVFDEIREDLQNGVRYFFSEKEDDQRLSDFIWDNYQDSQSNSNEITLENWDSVWSFLNQQESIDFLTDIWSN